MAPRTVLLATEKAFAAPAVAAIEKIVTEAGYTMKKLENYKEKSELLAAVAGVDAMIVRSDKIDGEVMDAGKPSLKLVVRAGAGVDAIDLGAATEREMVIMNTPGQNANAVAELAFGMMVMHIRNHYDGTSGWELKGKTLGLYGFGQVARNMHRLAQGFGMSTVAFDPFIKDEDITAAGATPVKSYQELFDCQFVSLHIPATDETKKSINGDLFKRLPKKGVVINTARQEVIDEDTMLAALQERADIGYLSDVMPKNIDAIKGALGENFAKRVFVTPKKMGAQTSEANDNAGTAAARQIVDFFEKGDARFQVNKDGKKF